LVPNRPGRPSYGLETVLSNLSLVWGAPPHGRPFPLQPMAGSRFRFWSGVGTATPGSWPPPSPSPQVQSRAVYFSIGTGSFFSPLQLGSGIRLGSLLRPSQRPAFDLDRDGDPSYPVILAPVNESLPRPTNWSSEFRNWQPVVRQLTFYNPSS
jgi:hypothetical protein